VTEDRVAEQLAEAMAAIDGVDQLISYSKQMQNLSFEDLSRNTWKEIQENQSSYIAVLEMTKDAMRMGSKAIGNDAFEAHLNAVMTAED